MTILGRHEVGLYAWKLSIPLLGIFVFAPLLLLAAIPGFLINVLSGNDYLIGIDYHYNYHTLPILFAATASGIATIHTRKWLPAERARAVIMTTLIVIASVVTNITWSHAPVSSWKTLLVHQWQFLRDTKEWTNFKSLTALLPLDPDIPVAASHNLVPALAHRNEIYMFPNPWLVNYWGIAGERQHSPDRVEWLVLDKRYVGKEYEPLVTRLFNTREFCKVAEEGEWLVAKRNVPAGALQNTAPACVPLRSDEVLHAAPLEQGIRGQIFIEKAALTSLRSLFGRKPDFEIQTDSLAIPETQGALTLSDGQSLKASDNVRVVFTGKWRANGKANTIFRVKADDGCRLYLDGNLIIDYNGTHSFAAEALSKPIHLDKGLHAIVVDYFEWGGNAGLSIEWESANNHFEQLHSGSVLP
jgi:hypothetical protein